MYSSPISKRCTIQLNDANEDSMNIIELSLFGQIVVMVYTFIFSLNAFMCIGKYFHKRPLSNAYDVVQEKYGAFYTIMSSAFNFGFIVVLISLLNGSENVIMFGIMVCTMVMFVILFCLIVDMAIWSYYKITEIHERLGKRE